MTKSFAQRIDDYLIIFTAIMLFGWPLVLSIAIAADGNVSASLIILVMALWFFWMTIQLFLGGSSVPEIAKLLALAWPFITGLYFIMARPVAEFVAVFFLAAIYYLGLARAVAR